MSEAMTLQQLSRFTGEPIERLEDWRSRGLIGSPAMDGVSADDIEKARLVQLFLRRGISLDAISEAFASGAFDWFFTFPFGSSPGPVHSMAEAAELLDLSLETLQRFRDAMGTAPAGDVFSEDEMALLRSWKTASQAGVPEDAAVELIRVYVDNLGRIAEAEERIFHFYVQDRLEAEGLSGQELVAQAQAAGDTLVPLVEPIILYFHRASMVTAVREDLAMRLAEQQGLVRRAGSPADMYLAIVFIDLASFTPMAQAMGDVAAAGVLERFSAIVRRSVNAWGGRVVKQIGDAFMLVFPDSRSAVAATLEVELAVASEPQFPAVRAGIQWGRVLYREGDYVGSNVNIASRLASEAERHQVLVTAEVRKEARDLPGVEYASLGKRSLKGLTGTFELFAVVSSAAASGDRMVDPVCGMEMGAAEVAARLSLEGSERVFCSEECLRKFISAPEQYAPQARP